MKTSSQIGMGSKIGLTIATAIAWFLGTGGILLADPEPPPPPPRPPVHFPFSPLVPPCNLCDQSDRAACDYRPSLCALQSSATVAIYCCVNTIAAPPPIPLDFTPAEPAGDPVALQ